MLEILNIRNASLIAGRLIAISYWLLANCSLSAQTSDVSPYSRYGLGDLNNQPGAMGFSMGETGNALHNQVNPPFFINLKNPASYCYYSIIPADSTEKSTIKMATFEAGLIDNDIRLSSQGITSTSNNGYFGYAAFAFPVSKRVGAGFGIVPFSSVGYIINTTTYANNIGTMTNEYSGAGGINRIYTGLGYKPFKWLSLGANLNYIFGTIANTEDLIYPTNLQDFNSERVETTSIHDFYGSYGIMLDLLPKNAKEWYLTLGCDFSLSAPISVTYNLLEASTSNGFTGNYYNDTIVDSGAAGKLRIPMMIGGGIAIGRGDKWCFTADFDYGDWSKFNYFSTEETLANSWHAGAGFQFVPRRQTDPGIESYFSVIRYRIGFSVSQSYLNIDNTPVNDYAISLGLACPLGRFKDLSRGEASVLNLGVQFGQMGTTSNNLLQEQYVKILFSFTFNSRWFWKTQYQ
jgi:hypothetical protein